MTIKERLVLGVIASVFATGVTTIAVNSLPQGSAQVDTQGNTLATTPSIDTKVAALEAQIKNLQAAIQQLAKRSSPAMPLVEADRRTKEDGQRRCKAIGGTLDTLTFPGTTAAPSAFTCRF